MEELAIQAPEPEDYIMVPRFRQAQWQYDCRHMNKTDFAMAVMTAKDGTVFLYFTGDLASAMLRHSGLARLEWERRHPAVFEAYSLYEAGWVDLVQRKLRGTGEYEYLAIKKTRP